MTESQDSNPDDAREALDASEQVRAIFEVALRNGPDAGRTLKRLEPSQGQLKRKDLNQDIDLKKFYGYGLLFAMIGQLAVADLAFFLYASLGYHWQLPNSVINVWIAGTLVEVIGVVLVVTRYLFPRRDTSAPDPPD